MARPNRADIAWKELTGKEGRAWRQAPNPDGTATLRDPETAGRFETLTPNQPGLDLGKWLDDYTAVQFAIWRIVEPLTIPVLNRAKLGKSGIVECGTTHVPEVYLDWPDATDSAFFDGAPGILVGASEETTFDTPGDLSGFEIDDTTVDKFCKGTVLQHLYEADTTVELIAQLASKDIRAGFRKALIDAFAGEPQAIRPGRVVVVPEYFDLPVRLELRSCKYEDGPDTARSNTWPLIVKISASLQVARLVPTPPELVARFQLDPCDEPCDAG